MRPSPRCILLFAAGIPVALLSSIVHVGLWAVWPAYLAAALAACAADLVFGLARRRLTVRANAPHTLFIGASAPLEVSLSAPPSSRPRRIEVLCRLVAKLVERTELPESEIVEALIKSGVEF